MFIFSCILLQKDSVSEAVCVCLSLGLHDIGKNIHCVIFIRYENNFFRLLE